MSIVSKKINYLVDHNYSVDIYSIKHTVTPFYELRQSVRIFDFNISDGNILVRIKNFISFIRKSDYDIIISADAQIVTWILPFITSNKKTILELHQSFDGINLYLREKYNNSLLKCGFFKFIKKLAYPKYTKVIVLTNEDKEKWNLKNSEVIPNFHVLPINISDNDCKTAICVGRLQNQKGFDLLIKVWTKVCEMNPKLRLLYFGADDNEHNNKILSKHNAPESFILMGFESNPIKIYSNAGINIVPSRHESFSLSLLEAMCFGVPTIAFNSVGPRSIIADSDAGILIDCYDIDAMANSIISLLENSERYNRMRYLCNKRAQDFTENKVMRLWMDLFEKL